MLATTLHLAALAAPSTSFAQSHDSSPLPDLPPPSVGNDIIYTKNGGMLRGTIIEAIPDAQARIQLVTGEVVTVPWPDVDRVERGARPPPVPVAALAAKPPPPSDVWVHLVAPAGALLQQDTTNEDDWVTVCSAPCDKLLPTTFHYRVSGSSIKSSADLVLHASPGSRETLVVDGASKSASVLGAVSLTGGVITGYVGLLDLTIGALDGGASTTICLVLLGMGTAASVAGLLLTGAKTTVSEDLHADRPPVVSPASWTATPAWRAAATEQKNLPPAVGIPIPIFSGRF